MNKDITIGIPRSLLYYRYHYLWENFFDILNINYIISGETNNKTVEDGSNYSVDESCLSLKIFLGHVSELIDKCSYVLIPRIVSIRKKEKVCTNFSLLYDLVNTIFKCDILIFEIDVSSHISEIDAFINIGKKLGISRIKAINAYNKAKKFDIDIKRKLLLKQNTVIATNKKKVLLVGHPYNLYDSFTSNNIIKILEENDISILYSDVYSCARMEFEASVISDCYWSFNKELFGAITHYKNAVDGIIIISSFPCGPDSLTNEMILRMIKDKPISVFVMDELSNDLGIRTRIESFIDIIKVGEKL